MDQPVGVGILFVLADNRQKKSEKDVSLVKVHVLNFLFKYGSTYLFILFYYNKSRHSRSVQNPEI